MLQLLAVLMLTLLPGYHGSDLDHCRWTDPMTRASFDLSPLDATEGHYAFHGVIGDHEDSLLAQTGAHASFQLADYVYYLNLCGEATNFSFAKCDGKPAAAAFQTHKDVPPPSHNCPNRKSGLTEIHLHFEIPIRILTEQVATNDDCFSLGTPDSAKVALIDVTDPHVGIQVRFSGGDSCHKKIEHPKTSHGCEDIPDWKDSQGNSCAMYAREHQCSAAYIPSMAANGVDAREACCASCKSWWKKTVSCPLLDRPENGERVKYTNMRKWPSLATYSCKSGYELDGGYSRRECGPDGQWKGEAPMCKEEQYYGRYGRGRYRGYHNGEEEDNEDSTPSLEAEVEVEWVHEPRSIMINMTCDPTITNSWADVINMVHLVHPLEAEMCEYVVNWRTSHACPLSAAAKIESDARRPSSSELWAWLPSLLFWCVYLCVLQREGVRSRVLEQLPPVARHFFQPY